MCVNLSCPARVRIRVLLILLIITCKIAFKTLSKHLSPDIRRSVSPSVRNAFVSAGRDEPANNLFCVYELVIAESCFSSSPQRVRMS